jgi:inositol phosphorylceramide mannosyltransferase catalytic subunit
MPSPLTRILTMRRSLLIFLLGAILLLTFLLHSVSTLVSLLFEDASLDAIPRSEIPSPNSTLLDHLPHLKIPKIIHQTYINESIPAHWVPAQQSCIDVHPDYEYILWTDAKSLEFIAKEYPWFLATFSGYKHPIQRADAIRYFVLAHYGGVYIDLDDGCKRKLDPLLTYNAFVRRTVPTGISNDVMGAIPGHPFFKRVMESLQGANRSWFLPYITIMASTGPLFLSVMWKNWMDEHKGVVDPETWVGRVRVLMPEEYNKHSWSFFETYKGSSWHGKDARLIFWMGKNWLLLVVIGTIIVLTLGVLVWFVCSRIILWTARRRKAARLGASSPERERSTPRTSPRMGASKVGKGQIPAWRVWAGMAKKSEYEMVAQHDA